MQIGWLTWIPSTQASYEPSSARDRLMPALSIAAPGAPIQRCLALLGRLGREEDIVSNGRSAAETRTELWSPADIKGNFSDVYTAVESEVRRKLDERHLVVPTVPGEFMGDWRFDGQYFQATSSTLVVITSPVVSGEYVLKVLREPNYRVRDSSGPIWSNDAGHMLFPWSGANDDDLESGIGFQHDSLMGELSRGALFNPEHSPYVGLVGVEQIDASTLRLRPIDECSVPERVFPGLLMEKVPVVASVANVIAEWPALWPEFSATDVGNLCAAGALAFDRGSIEAPPELQSAYGTADFFRHCLVDETPLQTARMGELPQYRDNPAIVAAADYAKRTVDVFDRFIGEHTDRLDEVGRTVVIGHADTKPSNAAIAATSRDEVVEMVKNPDLLKFVLLDAQSLAVKAAMLHGTEEGGVYYAHWPFVPRVQQLAYSLKSLLGLGLDEMHDDALDRVLQGAFDTTLNDWDQWWLAFYYIQVAYKMGGVEPLVNADNYNAKSPAEIEGDHRLQLVMERYPARALEFAERGLRLARTAR